MIFVWYRNQIAAIRITPKVERTGKDSLSTPRFLRNANTTMTTSIQKCAKLSLFISGSEYRRTKIIDRQKTAWFSQFTRQTNQLRMVAKEHVPLFRGDIRADVGCHRHSILYTGINVLAFISLAHQFFEYLYLSFLFHVFTPY